MTAETVTRTVSGAESQYDAPPKAKPVSAPLRPDQIAIVKSTAPLLKEHGEKITTLFYNNMLDAHPELKNIFNHTSQATGAQPRALAGAVFAYATYIDDLGKLSDAVYRMATKHVSLLVREEHYPIVGKHLIEAVATVLGDAVTPEVAEAWTAAYNALADILINAEKQIYSSWGEWDSWRRFKVQKKVAESSEITSFYLAPEDGKPLPSFEPGQYISLRIFVPQLNCMQPRQYSLSDAPGAPFYRISVKKEAGKEAGIEGLISNHLHDEVKEGDVLEITHPAGDFSVDAKDGADAPLVLISAGVGVTPMVAILNSMLAAKSARPVSWIHGAHSSETQAFTKHIEEARAAYPGFRSTVFRTAVAEEEQLGVDYHFVGRMDLGKVHQQQQLFLDDSRAAYYICGPPNFMDTIKQYLTAAGVQSDRIHVEIFGVGDGK